MDFLVVGDCVRRRLTLLKPPTIPKQLWLLYELRVLVEMGSVVVGDSVMRRLSLLKPPVISSKLRLSNELA